MSRLTIDEFKEALPPQVKKSVNQQLVDEINNIVADPEVHEVYRETLLGYGRVMMEGKFKLSNYVDAVKYCSHKFMGETNISAYSNTFPNKMKRFANEGTAAKDIASYVTAYHKSKLVTLIMKQAMIPVYITNQDNVQKAINVLAELMLGAKSEKVRSDSASALLTHLKQPETQKIELDIGVKEDSSIEALRQQTMKLAAQQKLAIESGQMNAQQIAHQKLIIDADIEEVNV